jgi:flagellar biosynthetic protein FliP
MSLSAGQSEPEKVSVALELMFLFTVLAVAPSIVLTMTSYTRIIIVFHFLRQAMGTPQMPPAQIMASLALFMSIIIMGPVIKSVNEEALQPYMEEKIGFKEALDRAQVPVRAYLFKHTRERTSPSSIPSPRKTGPRTRSRCPPSCWWPPTPSASSRPAFPSGFSSTFRS